MVNKGVKKKIILRRDRTQEGGPVFEWYTDIGFSGYIASVVKSDRFSDAYEVRLSGPDIGAKAVPISKSVYYQKTAEIPTLIERTYRRLGVDVIVK